MVIFAEVYLPGEQNQRLALVMFQLLVDWPPPAMGETWAFEEFMCRVREVTRVWGNGKLIPELHAELELLPDVAQARTARDLQQSLIACLERQPAVAQVRAYADDPSFLDQRL